MGQLYIDPENNNAQVTSVKLKSRESKILLFKQITTSSKEIHQTKDGQLNLFPVPVIDVLHIKLSVPTAATFEQYRVKLFSQTGRLVKLDYLQAGQEMFTIAVGDLEPGIYFLRLPELGYTGKFVKTGELLK